MNTNLNQLLWAARTFERNRQWALDELRIHRQPAIARRYAARAREAWAQIQSLTPLINQALQA